MTDDPRVPTFPRRTLYSAAQIHHLLRVEFNRALRHRYPLTGLAIAIDRLEILRDRLGYEAKERVVDAVVELLRAATRSSDAIGRTADDKLITVVPHTDREGARVLCQRLVERAREIRVERLAEPFPVTLSVGMASTPTLTSMFHDALLAAAEAALADASTEGGDRFAERDGVAPAH